MGTARRVGLGGYRLFYIYGGAIMKQYEISFYENYCKRCKSLAHCPWRNISDDTCLEMTGFEEREENEKDNGNERKETV